MEFANQYRNVYEVDLENIELNKQQIKFKNSIILISNHIDCDILLNSHLEGHFE